MPAAANRSDLRAVTIKEYTKLSGLIVPLDPSLVHSEWDGTTIKDVIAHRAHWITLFLGWYADGQAGNPVHFLAKGYKWNDLKRYNADLRQRQQDLTWNDARKMLENSHADLIAFIDTHDNAALYGGPMKGANNNWTPGRWAKAAGASHYRSAAKYIRAAQRHLRAG